jgi:hypothetical protein
VLLSTKALRNPICNGRFGHRLSILFKCPTCEHTFQSTAVEEPASVPSEPPEAAQAGGEQDQQLWEEPQRFQGRRDAEPHRGTLILVLGISSIVSSATAGCLMGVGGLIGLPLGIAAWVMGRRDLIKMRDQVMDDEGKELTKAGWICGIIGTIMGSVCSLGLLAYIGFLFTLIPTFRRAPPPPMPAPAPAPIRPPPAPPPGPPADRAALYDLHKGWHDHWAESKG